jgi:hypothetical protein
MPVRCSSTHNRHSVRLYTESQGALRLNRIAASDLATLEGLTQFLTQSLDASPQIAEDKSVCGTQDLKEGFALHCFGLLAAR